MAGTTKLMTAGGGGVSLTPASSIASDVTVNVPSQNCTLGIQGPSFSAYQSSSQTLSSGTWTKLQFQTEEWDTASCFDNATNYRFTPNVQGYYQISGGFTGDVTTAGYYLQIYKNGDPTQGRRIYAAGSASVNGAFGSATVFFNGTTDYIELYGWIGTGQTVAAFPSSTYFQASLVRAA